MYVIANGEATRIKDMAVSETQNAEMDRRDLNYSTFVVTVVSATSNGVSIYIGEYFHDSVVKYHYWKRVLNFMTKVVP